jgi:peptidoglycan glycosyltransferase
MKPTVIQRILSPGGGTVQKLKPHRLSQATKPSTAAELKNMMVEAVQAGTGTAAQIPGVVVAGKTGTAETSRAHVYDAWFIFFAPADDPTVAGAVVIENQLNGFGGAVAAPIAKQLMQAILPSTSNSTSQSSNSTNGH